MYSKHPQNRHRTRATKIDACLSSYHLIQYVWYVVEATHDWHACVKGNMQNNKTKWKSNMKLKLRVRGFDVDARGNQCLDDLSIKGKGLQGEGQVAHPQL